MRITKHLLAASVLTLGLTLPARAEENAAHDMAAEHGGQVFHAFRLEAEYGTNGDGPVAGWDFDGWIGTDEDKLWLKSEGEHADDRLEHTEFWALYSRNVDTFWDLQAGIRQDTRPSATTYAVVGINGLAPYFFETEAHLFVSDEGDVTARLHQENELLLTQQLVAQPYAEINLSAQDIPDAHVGAGLTDGKIGLQLRYEFSRKFAPYVDIHYGRRFGETASIARRHGEDDDEVIGAIGLRLMF